MGMVEEWAEGMRGEGVRRDYQRIVHGFLEFCGKGVEAVRAEDVRAWKAWLEKEEYAASTMRTYLATAASFFDYACERGLVESNPVANELLPKATPYASGRYLSEDEEARLLAAIDVDTEWGMRDYALILFLVRSGRRTGEALGLRWGDFEVMKDGVWYCWKSKRKDLGENGENGMRRLTGSPAGRKNPGNQRRARLDWEAWTAICKYLESCGRLGKIGDEEVIFTPLSDVAGRVERLYGKDWRRHALSEANIGRLIRMYANWAGLAADEITPKALRYTALVRRKQAGWGLEEMRQDLGYESLDAVRRAIQMVEIQEAA